MKIIFYLIFLSSFLRSEENLSDGVKIVKNEISYSTVSLSGYASLWISKKSGKTYDLPVPILVDSPFDLDMKVFYTGGYIDLKTEEIKYDNVMSVVKFYSICPYDKKCPQDSYFSLEIYLSIDGREKAVCGGYFNQQDFIPFPVAFCSGYDDMNNRIGITLHRIKYNLFSRHK